MITPNLTPKYQPDSNSFGFLENEDNFGWEWYFYMMKKYDLNN